MLDLYDGPHQSEIVRLVGPCIRSLKKRHQMVLSSHCISFARGSDLSKLRVCYRNGQSFQLDDFDLADLGSVSYNILSGAKVSPLIFYDLIVILVPYYYLTYDDFCYLTDIIMKLFVCILYHNRATQMKQFSL